MPDEPNLEPWIELGQLAEAASPQALVEFVENLSASDAALALSRLSDEQRTRVLTALPAEEAADLLNQLPDVQAVGLIE